MSVNTIWNRLGDDEDAMERLVMSVTGSFSTHHEIIEVSDYLYRIFHVYA